MKHMLLPIPNSGNTLVGSTVILGDCVQLMKEYEDRYFDLAIVDPEYGINAALKTSYHANAFTNYTKKHWDKKIPDETYFSELFRVSKHQIIWGGNYFTDFLPPMPKWIVWDKMQPEGIDQAMFELAWNSNTKKQSKIYRQSAQSNANKVANNKELAKKYIRFHPTQKPVKLYKWLLKNYADVGFKILDTHLGSQSSRIAADEMGFDFTGMEIDNEYYEKGNKRYEQYKSQLRIEGW